jgi:hypothetical protein
MLKRTLFLLFISLFVVHSASGQKKKKPSKAQQDLFGNAEYFFDNEEYIRALPFYQQLAESDPTNAYYKYKKGICYLHKSDEKELSITELENANKIDNTLPDITFYLGRAYHLNNKFDEAIELFNQYIAQNPPTDMKKAASHYIEYCQNGKVLIQTPIVADIVNLGPPINTKASEYAPVISSDESTLIFTYKGERSTGGLMDDKFNPDPDGHYYEDIFISHRVGKDWLTPESISDKINTKGHDASIALSSDGQTLFIYKSTPKDNGDIFMSTLKGEEWSTPVRIGPNINTSAWEGSCSISSDGKLLYFASERKGGYGGRDIYVSQRQPDGEWGPAKNLGPSVNTQYDDDAPFIHPDGIDLFFSSQGHNSMGGYDIMYSTKKGDDWSEPTNLGYPLNTTEDERYYVLTASGEFGYFSTDRKGTLGEQDIYTVTPGFQGDRPVLALVVGTITANDKPIDAKINVTNMTTGETQGTYHSNSSSGKYLIALTPGHEYKVAIEVEGMESHIEYVNVKSIDTYVQVNNDVKLYSQDYKLKNHIAVADSSESLQSKIDAQIRKYKMEQKTDVYEANTYNDLLKKHGEDVRDSLIYKVEFGRFECARDFDTTKVFDLRPIAVRTDSSKNTIYSIGPYNTLLEAELQRQKALKMDTSLHAPSVLVFDKGVRKTIQQYYSSFYNRKDYVIPTDTKIQKCKETNVSALTNDVQYDKLIKDYGTFEADGLTYKLELASVDNETDFDPALFEKYGKVEKKKYADGKTRYSMGPFKTLKEAEEFKATLVAKESRAAKSIVTVFVFGQRKTVPEYFETPCKGDTLINFSAFVGKDLNDKVIYDKLIATGGNFCAEGLVFTVQIGAYRHPENFKHKNLNSLEPPPAKVLPYPDGITRFTMREFKTLKDAEQFRQQAIRLGTRDAWITATYKGERKLLQDCIANNFWGKAVN